MVYDGRWFSPLRQALDGFVSQTQRNVTGDVTLKLYKGNVVPHGMTAAKSLYNHDLASFSDTDLYDQQDAKGFIKLYGLPMKVQGMIDRGQ